MTNKVNGKQLEAIKDKVVLITGGTGSLGYALTKRLTNYAKKIIIYSRCEFKQYNMSQVFKNATNIRYFFGDIRDQQRLETALDGVDICIHGACYKRIDGCSFNPFETIKTNVVGSMNVANACINKKIKKVILVSTDKAAEAGTLYGGTKFVSEQMFINANNYSKRDSVLLSAVRYGNVYGSNGSIRHIFERQAKESSELTLTHKDMTRFFMSLDDACNLIFFCAAEMVGGEIFVPKMKSISIKEYADMFFPNTPIRYIGLRGHEKIHEKLISETEGSYVVRCNESYYKIVPPSANIPGIGWNVEYPNEPRVNVRLDSDTADKLTRDDILKMESQGY